jgi:hypothetical protein
VIKGNGCIVQNAAIRWWKKAISLLAFAGECPRLWTWPDGCGNTKLEADIQFLAKADLLVELGFARAALPVFKNEWGNHFCHAMDVGGISPRKPSISWSSFILTGQTIGGRSLGFYKSLNSFASGTLSLIASNSILRKHGSILPFSTAESVFCSIEPGLRGSY